MKTEAGLADSQVVSRALKDALRRHWVVILAAEAPVALAIVLCGLLLVILTGTSLLHPVWLIVFVCAALAVAFVRTRRQTLTKYSLAQVVDARLQLNDTLSTACFLLSSARPITPAATFQLESAAAVAQQVSPRMAFPFERRRTWYVVLLLLLALGSAMIARYASLGSLDLHAPMLHIAVIAQLRPAAKEMAKRAPIVKKRAMRQPDLALPDPLMTADANERARQMAAGGDPADAIRQFQQQLQAKGKDGDRESALGRTEDAMRGLGSNLKQALQQKGQTAANTDQQTARREANAARDSSSDPRSDAAAQSSSKPSQDEHPGAQTDSHGEENQSAKTEARAVENHTGSPLGPADQAAQEKGNDAQSGAGRDEGQKTIHDAEQLKAVGKLERIIGKRSASITGEMHVAKSSHDQQLQTQYSSRLGEHSDRGGQIHRDHVPPQYRDYVRAYMDAIHSAAERQH